MYRLLLASIALGAAFQFAYIEYINPLFEYAGYLYFPPSDLSLVFAYLLIAVPVIGYRSSMQPAAFGSAFIYALCYVPAQLILLFNWSQSPSELAYLQTSVAASMTVLFHAARYGGGKTSNNAPQNLSHLKKVMFMLTLISGSIFVLNYYEHMRLVSFEDVYDLRADSSRVDKGAFVNYLTSWLSYCFIPFYFAYGILRKDSRSIAIGLFGSLLIYMATGAKASLLMGGIMYGVHICFGSSKDFLYRLLVIPTVGILICIFFLPDEGLLFVAKSVVLIRILATGGWTMSAYHEYFSANGYTYYSHIGPINALTQSYPYGEYSLGQLIGQEYSGSIEANFNANFWASDAFAAWGMTGVPIATAAVCLAFYMINRCARGYTTEFVVLWYIGFWLALLNVPLSVALLSGGGILTAFILRMSRG